MSRYRKKYSAEFKEQILDLIRTGRTPRELAKEYEPTEETIRKWILEADPSPSSSKIDENEREELRRLRRENRILREEKEILKKAAAWFAQETNATPKKRSSS